MLVLTRRPNAGDHSVITISDPKTGHDRNDSINDSIIEVTVTSVEGGQVRIGVQAPRSLAVHRAEVYEQIQAEGRDALPPIAERIAE